METLCNLCHNLVDQDDPSVWVKVEGWVHGPKQNGLTLSSKLHEYAHGNCIKAAQEGQVPGQGTLFDLTEETQS